MTRAAALVAVILTSAVGTAAASAQDVTPVQQQDLAQSPEQDAQPAQSPPASRTAAIEEQQAEKARSLEPFKANKVEAYVTRVSGVFLAGQMQWHSFFHNAYSGGGFTLGAGYTQFVSPNNFLDTRGSITFKGYKRIESEFIAPGLMGRRGTFSAIAGWREATQVGFYGFGTNSTVDARTNYAFQQPHGSATLDVHPARNSFFLRGSLEITQWKQQSGSGSAPSVETVYTPETLPGLGAQPVYFHTTTTVGFDSRPSPGYARDGGLLAATFQDFTDPDQKYGLQELDYEAIRHIPIGRDRWVASLHGILQTSYSKSGQQIPFFMMPSIGGGDNLRAYASWRLRDLNSLLLQAEWRVIVNRFLDMAIFYDTGRVAPRLDQMKLDDLKYDAGLGFRFHGPIATPLRIDLAKGTEGFAIVFAASQAF
jgi:hypothetical protein